MHCFSTHFFQMLIGLEALPEYNYSAVQNWNGNINNVSSILDIHKLYIPINKGQSHWLLLRVRLEDKSIELWDSCSYDYDETNEVFLQSSCRYLYGVQTHEYQHNQGTLEEWRMAWNCSNQSLNSSL